MKLVVIDTGPKRSVFLVDLDAGKSSSLQSEKRIDKALDLVETDPDYRVVTLDLSTQVDEAGVPTTEECAS